MNPGVGREPGYPDLDRPDVDRPDVDPPGVDPPVRGHSGLDRADPFSREQLLAEREELSRTVQALAERFDVGARARAAAGNARSSGARVWGQIVHSDLFVPVAAAAGAALALVVAAAVSRPRTGAVAVSGRSRPRS